MSEDTTVMIAELCVPAAPEYLAVCRVALAGVGESLGLSDDAIEDGKLVLSELCANAIRHGYADDDSEVITVSFRTTANRLEVEVADDGPGVDPAVARGVGFELLRQVAAGYRICKRGPHGGASITFWCPLPA